MTHCDKSQKKPYGQYSVTQIYIFQLGFLVSRREPYQRRMQSCHAIWAGVGLLTEYQSLLLGL